MNRTTREVLQLLRMHGRISRAQLAAELGLTRTAIGTTVDALLKAGIIESVGMNVATSRGRPSEILQVTGNGLYCVGISISVYYIDMVILDWFNNTVASRRIGNVFRQRRDDPVSAVDEVIAALDQMMQEAGITHINGGAIAFSSDVHDETGKRFLLANDFTSVEQANSFLDRLKTHLAAPIWLERDVDAALLAERWLAGNLPQYPNMFYVNDRLGFAMILDGKPWRGPAVAPRWLARIQVDPHGKQVPGLPMGALFNSSVLSIVDRHRGDSVARQPASWPSISHEAYQEIYGRYEKQDPEIVAEFRQSFRDLAQVIGNLVSLFSFDVVVLDGWTPCVLKDGIPIIQQALAELVGRPGWPLTVIRAASLRDSTQAVGAAISSIDHVLASRKAPITACSGKKRGSRSIRKA